MTFVGAAPRVVGVAALQEYVQMVLDPVLAMTLPAGGGEGGGGDGVVGT